MKEAFGEKFKEVLTKGIYSGGLSLKEKYE